jgi:hypothetical protein
MLLFAVLILGIYIPFALGFVSVSQGLRLKSSRLQMSSTFDPILLRAARGEKVERPPVWMMRQAGRHMQAYRDLCKTHKTFRERSENADISTEIRYNIYYIILYLCNAFKIMNHCTSVSFKYF